MENDFVEGLYSQDDCEAEVTNSGAVLFKHLKINYHGNIALNGYTTDLRFSVRITGRKGELMNTPSQGSEEEAGLVRLHIMPKEFPGDIEVLYEGQPLPKPFIRPVGDCLDQLSFRVLRADGQPLQDFKESWLEGSRCGTCSCLRGIVC